MPDLVPKNKTLDLPDDSFFHDHVHLSKSGHQFVAEQLTKALSLNISLYHMSHLINSQSVLETNDDTILLDVRSPVEYKKGHIPSAISLPLFSDEERKNIGILYKNEGAQTAFYKGLRFVGPKMRTIVERVWSLSENRKKIVIYCREGESDQNLFIGCYNSPVCKYISTERRVPKFAIMSWNSCNKNIPPLSFLD